jgi:hypothetical protein
MLSAIGSFLGGASGLGSLLNAGASVGNWLSGNQANEQNSQLSREQYEYQKGLNALQMQREDTSVQRRVADLKAAGLSPTLASGSSASTAPVRAGEAPSRSYTPLDASPIEAALRYRQMDADYSYTEAQKKLVDEQMRFVFEQSRALSAENDYYLDYLDIPKGAPDLAREGLSFARPILNAASRGIGHSVNFGKKLAPGVSSGYSRFKEFMTRRRFKSVF